MDINTLSQIFSFLTWKEILRARVSKQWREAAGCTLVPESQCALSNSWFVSDIFVKNRDVANALVWISRALPHVPRIDFDFSLGAAESFKVLDGDDPEPTLRLTSDNSNMPAPIDLRECLINFRGLRHLRLDSVSLNGKYPFIFQFLELESLSLTWSGSLKWDLADLANLRKLKKLRVVGTRCTGNLCSLRHLREILEDLCLSQTHDVEGSIHDLADFVVLQKLSLRCPNVTGDIRKIGHDDFVAINQLDIDSGVYGGGNMDRINDATALMTARYYLKKRSPELFTHRRWRLSRDSPDFYEIHGHHSRAPPFCVEFVKAGSRLGWRWTNAVSGGSCEAIWFDPEPSPSVPNYHEYVQEKKDIDRDVDFYRGFSAPPSADQHRELSDSIPLDPLLQRFSSPSSFGVW